MVIKSLYACHGLCILIALWCGRAVGQTFEDCFVYKNQLIGFDFDSCVWLCVCVCDSFIDPVQHRAGFTVLTCVPV